MPYPFDRSGTEAGPDGIRRYTGLAQNLLQLLRASVEAHPDSEALVELGGERVTYRQLWTKAARVAGGLRAAGVQPGDRVANRLANGNDWVYAFWGTLLAGAVTVPVNTRFAEPEVRYVVEDSGATYVVEPGGELPDGEPLEVTDQGHGDLAAIFYTSGTTGFPKGAMTTHENFLSNIETCLRCLSIPREQLSTLISVPLFHVTGCNSQLLVVTAVAGSSVILPTFEPQAFLRAIADEKIAVLTTVPAIYWLALQQPNFAEIDTSSVRSLSYGG
ncbi:MAG: long-chain acyl-CoA synthetase, partial [Blastococcus sp.]|nr:long-chain acyl-CoA synthetase [Blastococcus sp.]